MFLALPQMCVVFLMGGDSSSNVSSARIFVTTSSFFLNSTIAFSSSVPTLTQHVIGEKRQPRNAFARSVFSDIAFSCRTRSVQDVTQVLDLLCLGELLRGDVEELIKDT